MPVEIKEIVLQARIDDGGGAEGDTNMASHEDPFCAGDPDDVDEDRDEALRRRILADCARMIRSRLADRDRR